MVKKIIAYAVVKRKNPKLTVKDIYQGKDIENVFVSYLETVIRVEISPIVASRAPKLRYKKSK